MGLLDGLFGTGSSGTSPSSLDSASGFLDRAKGRGFGELIVTGLGAIWLGFASGVISLQQGIFAVFVKPLAGLATGAYDLVIAFLSAPARFLGGAWQFALTALQSPPWSTLGPFAPWVATAVVLGVVGAFSWYLDQRNSDVPGTGTDLPLIGNDSDGEED